MKQTTIYVLAALNVALAGTLAWRGIADNRAHAQAVARAEAGKYVMVPGASQLGPSIIYILDTANRRIGAVAPDAKETMNVMPTLALDPVFDAAATGGGPAVNPENQRNNQRGRAGASAPGSR